MKANKEEYEKQIKAIGQYLIDNADTILNDYETNMISEINIISTISYGEVPTVNVTKSYVPREVLNGI